MTDTDRSECVSWQVVSDRQETGELASPTVPHSPFIYLTTAHSDTYVLAQGAVLDHDGECRVSAASD